MPKVSAEYIEEKKLSIQKALRKLAYEKPIYSITMQELIDELQMSQGAIYRYYKDIDQIIGDVYFNLNEQVKNTKIQIDRIFERNLQPEEVVRKIFACIGSFYSDPDSVYYELNRIIWSLNTLYLYDKQRVNHIAEHTDQNNNSLYIINKLLAFLKEQIALGYFHPIMSIDRIHALIVDNFDGIIHNYIRLTCHEKLQYQPYQKEMMDIPSLLDGLADVTIYLLGGNQGIQQ